MSANPFLIAIEAMRRCPGVDTTDQVTGQTFSDLLVAALDADLRPALRKDLAENTAKAWDALARYKFWMFGYHAAHVVKLRRILGLRGKDEASLLQFADACAFVTRRYMAGQSDAQRFYRAMTGGAIDWEFCS